MAQLVDTSVFIQLERRGGDLDELLQIDVLEDYALASITASELWVGVYRAGSQARRRRREMFVELVLAAIPVIPFDLEAAHVHASVVAALTQLGTRIGANDLIIAATALAHGYTVLTENIADFERVPGIDVQRPRWLS